jgi:(p)ppGpp synthase/HD superfamily hydrolase
VTGATGFTAYSPALDRAIAMAARAHRTQTRKGGDVPYVQHPVHVAFILLKHGLPEPVLLAALLHDVVEDCGVALEEIAREFGEHVAALVSCVTETKTDAGSSVDRPWRVRKEEQLAKLAKASPDVAALKAADALHNCHSTLNDLRATGKSAWRRFNAPPADQVWWYGSVASGVRARLGDHALAGELEAAVAELATFA